MPWIVLVGPGPEDVDLSLAAAVGTSLEAWRMLGRFKRAFPQRYAEVMAIPQHEGTLTSLSPDGRTASGEKQRVFVVELVIPSDDLYVFDFFDSRDAAAEHARAMGEGAQVHDPITNEWYGPVVAQMDRARTPGGR